MNKILTTLRAFILWVGVFLFMPFIFVLMIGAGLYCIWDMATVTNK